MSSKLTASQIRDLLKTRSHCLMAGFPLDHPLIRALDKLRNEYIIAVGLPTYLSQMLGPLATASIGECTLYDRRDRALPLDCDNPRQPLQRFIREQFLLGELPYRVEKKKGPQPSQVEVRYL